MNKYNKISNENNRIENTAEALSFPENQSTSVKERSEMIKAVVLSMGINILAFIIIFGTLFLTLNPSIALQNTLESFGINVRSFASLENKIQRNGAKGYVDLDIPVDIRNETVLYSLRTDFDAGKKSGWCNLELSTSKNQEAKINLVYSKNFIAIGNDDEGYISIPVNDFDEEFQDSIFNRENGSPYAISEELYNNILAFLNGEAPKGYEEEHLSQKTVDEIEKVMDKCAGILKTDDQVAFSLKPFGLVKKVEYTVNKYTLTELIRYLTDEFENNKKLAPLFESDEPIIDKTELLTGLRSFRASLSNDSYYRLSYTIYGGKITNISFEGSTKPDNADSLIQTVNIKFTHGRNYASMYCDISQRISANYGNQVVSASAISTSELELKKSKQINTYTFSNHKSENNGSGTTKEKGAFYAKLIHNTNDGKFYFSSGKTNEKKDTYVEGCFLINSKKGILQLTLTSIITKKLNLDWELMDINIKATASNSSPEIEHKNIMQMSVGEFEDALRIIPDKEVNEMIEAIEGDFSLLSYTKDGKLILDTAEYKRKSEDYKARYKKYYTDSLLDADAKCNDIYIFNEQTNHYYALTYISSAQISVEVYYELPSRILNNYHSATLSGEDILSVHQFDESNNIESTCATEGKITKKCSVCQHVFNITVKKRPHKATYTDISYMADNTSVTTGTLMECPDCGEIALLTKFYSMYFIPDGNGKYICNYTVKEQEYKYFKIPEELLPNIKISELNIDYGSFKIIRIPEGIDLENTFSRSAPKALVIPANTSAIYANTFSSLSNLQAVFFIGTEEQWNKVHIDSECKPFFDNAKIVFTDKQPTPTEICSKLD